MSQPAARRVLSIQSEVVHGHVGNSAARFILQRMGIDVLALPTVLFSNHPGHGGFRGRVTPVEELEALLEGLEARGLLNGVDAVLSGYLGDAAQAGFVARAVGAVRAHNPSAFYVLDPVFGDEAGRYARPGVAEAMQEQLLPLADLTTPNRFELAALAGRAVETETGTVEAARTLGRPAVLATSTPCNEGIGSALVTAADAFICRTRRVEDAPSGTGDALTALFVGHRLHGAMPAEALGKAAGALDVLITLSAGGRDLRLVAGQALIGGDCWLPASRIC